MKEEMKQKGIGTECAHNDTHEIMEHAHILPIFATSTFTFDDAAQGMERFSGKTEGYTYSRFGNPTTSAIEQQLARLEAHGLKNENGSRLELRALLHASGQSAMATMFLSNLKAGDCILSDHSLYGGTHEFLHSFLPQFGIKAIFADMNDLDLVEEVLQKNAAIRLLNLETPSNPTMQCVDIKAACDLAKKYNKKVTVDNTVATPYLQQPFAYGADFVFHSTTKFLNGHGSSIGGVLIGRDIEFMKTKAYNTYKLLGATSSPFDAFLLGQGIKTLPMRMEKHCSNAMLVANFLSGHPAVNKVYYNGLPGHPGYAISIQQMKRPGSLMSFELKGDITKAIQFIDKLKICVRAVSLGTTDTLISHPASMSHSGMPRDLRYKAGISDSLVRMSVGLEDVDDILNDLEQALQ
ncbi:MAG: aminotransferase class I/II-fold pyridoxal phosphate-dependent enzyme [Bacteroidetes bacterium]|nr:aminotransferase class I/II-fold pyridoxal phosphate-dependent enzyme [Bacteroidota bacterium]